MLSHASPSKPHASHVPVQLKPVEDMQGLNFLWSVAIEAELPEVAEQAQDLLVKVDANHSFET